MNNMEKLLSDFMTLCEAWRGYSKRVNGWETVDYCGGNVRCYFAKNSDHTAVKIDGIEIQFHDTPVIEMKVTLFSEDSIAKTIDRYRNELNALIWDEEKFLDSEIKDRAAQRKAILEKELEEINKNL